MDPSSKNIKGLEYIWQQYPIAQTLVKFLASPDLFSLSTVSLSLRHSLQLNGALRKVSTHSNPLSLERVIVVAPDVVAADIIPSFAHDLSKIRAHINCFDASYLTQLVLDGSCVGGTFITAVVQSLGRLRLLSVKHCVNIPLATINYLLDGHVPKSLETLMVWGLPGSAWLWNADTPGILASYESRMASRGIVAVIEKARDQDIYLDTGCCIARDGCRGRAWALRRMEFDPSHRMFSAQTITRGCIMMCEKRKIVCDSCNLVKDTVACLECMTEGLMRLGFCTECDR